MRNIPVNVFYPEKGERVTHFRPGKDFTRISILNTFLVLGALLFYYPWRFLRSLTKENIRRFVTDNITRSRIRIRSWPPRSGWASSSASPRCGATR